MGIFFSKLCLKRRMAKQSCRHIRWIFFDGIADTDGNVPTRWHALYYGELKDMYIAIKNYFQLHSLFTYIQPPT